MLLSLNEGVEVVRNDFVKSEGSRVVLLLSFLICKTLLYNHFCICLGNFDIVAYVVGKVKYKMTISSDLKMIMKFFY